MLRAHAEQADKLEAAEANRRELNRANKRRKDQAILATAAGLAKASEAARSMTST